MEFSQSSSHVNLASESAVLITIDIEGAVVSPGVYRLNLGSIIQDALVAARGLSKDPDRQFVAKNINLASKLTDAQQIYVPKVGEEAPQAQSLSFGTTTVGTL